MEFTRRQLTKLGLTAGAEAALPVGALSRPVVRLLEASWVASPEVEQFEVSLPRPPTAEPVRTDETTDYYEITHREETVEILPGYETTIWGYDGLFPGPTIEAQRGRNVEIEQQNELPVPVSVHLHGAVTPPESDGYPTDFLFPPGLDHDELPSHHTAGTIDGVFHGSKEYTYPNEQRAATLWYHDHRMDFTGPQVYKGLAGFYIIRDEIEADLPLPAGEKEIPLLICDRTFRDDGELYYPSLDPSLLGEHGVLPTASDGWYGDTILVNGAPWPKLEVSNTKYRFRMLNGSNARVYDLELDPVSSNGDAFIQVGSDGGLLETPLGHDRLRISPAERFDVIIDFSNYSIGTEVVLTNRRGSGKMGDVMQFEVTREEFDESEIPSTLAPPLEFPDPDDAVETRRFNFLAGMEGGMSTINLQSFDPERIDAKPKLDTTEIWELDSDPAHPAHLHLVHFKVLSRNSDPPGPYDKGWKDTVFSDGDTVEVVARFGPYRGKYVFHCHNLEHEDMMMLANFEVI